MHLFVDISSHGFGHFAMTAPVLNALAAETPDLRLTIRSGLPLTKLRERIKARFDFIEAASDFGFVMRDATRLDLAASAQAYRHAHQDWPGRVSKEASFIGRHSPDLVLTNVSYLPLAGAALAGIPSCSFCSLNWADLFVHFFGREAWAAPIAEQIQGAYRSAQAFLCVSPGMPMNDFANRIPVGPISVLGKAHDLGLGKSRAILISMGGIAHRLPIEAWPRLPEIRWLVPAEWQCQHPDALAIESFGLSFTDLLSSVHAVVTKPGYGTFTEAACNGTPVIYQRREDWPEQDYLIAWLQGHGRCREISADALVRGEVDAAISAIDFLPVPPRPALSGIADVVFHIRRLLTH